MLCRRRGCCSGTWPDGPREADRLDGGRTKLCRNVASTAAVISENRRCLLLEQLAQISRVTQDLKEFVRTKGGSQPISVHHCGMSSGQHPQPPPHPPGEASLLLEVACSTAARTVSTWSSPNLSQFSLSLLSQNVRRQNPEARQRFHEGCRQGHSRGDRARQGEQSHYDACALLTGISHSKICPQPWKSSPS